MPIVIVAQNAPTKFGGEALLPLNYFSILRSRQIETLLVVHARTQAELKALFPAIGRSNPHSAVLALMTKDYHTFSVGKISVPTFSNFSIIFLRFWRNMCKFKFTHISKYIPSAISELTFPKLDIKIPAT